MKSVESVLWWQRWFLLRQEIDRLLAASMTFSVLMVLARIAYTGRLTFIFLVWNLFLAYVPYLLTKWLQHHPAWIENKWKLALSCLVWILFLPNSFYIITDLLHLNGYAGIMKWFDLTLIISFAWNGLLLGVLSIREMEKIMTVFLFHRTTVLFILPVMWLNAFGVYVGRYLRFNSWDVLTNPFQLVDDIAYLLLHPFHNKPEWGMICVFAVFMSLIYFSLKQLSKTIR